MHLSFRRKVAARPLFSISKKKELSQTQIVQNIRTPSLGRELNIQIKRSVWRTKQQHNSYHDRWYTIQVLESHKHQTEINGIDFQVNCATFSPKPNYAFKYNSQK